MADLTPMLHTRASRSQLFKVSVDDLVANQKSKRSLNLELGGIKKALEAVEGEKKEIEFVEGLSQGSFFFGLLQLVVGVSIFWTMPEHFWLYYTVQNLICIPWWYQDVIRVYNAPGSVAVGLKRGLS